MRSEVRYNLLFGQFKWGGGYAFFWLKEITMENTMENTMRLKSTIYYGKYHRSTIYCIQFVRTNWINLYNIPPISATPFQLLKFHELQLFKLLRLPVVEYEHKGTFLRMFLNFDRVLVWIRPVTKLAHKMSLLNCRPMVFSNVNRWFKIFKLPLIISLSQKKA